MITLERVMKMEFHEKLQELRKQRNITQENLAQELYVSRTAISKWESGKGYPNIESLKAIAAFYGVTIDELLSSDEALTIAEEDHKERQSRFRDLVFGLLDISAVLFLLLPFFREKIGETVYAVSLVALSGISPYLRVTYFAAVIAMTSWGLLTLALQTCSAPLWKRMKTKMSCILHAVVLLLFILSPQPYAAAFLLLFLLIKISLLVKKR